MAYREVPVPKFKHSELGNLWRGIVFQPLNGYFHAFSGTKHIGHFDSLDEAVQGRDSFSAQQKEKQLEQDN